MESSALTASVDVLAVAGLALTAETRMPTAALVLTLAAGCLILLRLLEPLSRLLQAFLSLGRAAGAHSEILSLLLRIIGLAYAAEFAAQLCRDAGQGAAAFKVELAAKTAILLLALPVLASIISCLAPLL